MTAPHALPSAQPVEPSGNVPDARRFAVRLLLFAAVFAVAMPAIKTRPGDSAVYAKAARRLLEGRQFYDPGDRDVFTYPPFFVLPYVPLSLFPEKIARGLWYFVNVVLLGGIGFILIRSLAGVFQPAEAERRRTGRLALLVIVVLSARFVISPIENQSHDLIVFALVASAMATWDRSRGEAAGFFAGLATACKATPLLLLPLFLLQRRFRAASVFCLSLVGATLLPNLLFPQPGGGLWVASWYQVFVSKVDAGAPANAYATWASWNFLNQSLAGTTYRLFTYVPVDTHLKFDVSLVSLPASQLKLLTILLQAGVLVFLAYVCRFRRRQNLTPNELRFRRLGEFSVVLCGMLLLSPMSSKQHFCVLLFPIAYCTVWLVRYRRDWIVAVALAVVFVLGTLAVKDVVGRPVGDHLLAYGSLTYCTLAMLIGSGRGLLVSEGVVSASRGCLSSETAVEIRPQIHVAAMSR